MNILGKLRVTFTETTVATELDEDLGVNKYEVIDFDGSTITIRTEIGKDTQEFLKIDKSFMDIKYFKDGIKIYVEPKDYKSIILREYFKKVEGA